MESIGHEFGSAWNELDRPCDMYTYEQYINIHWGIVDSHSRIVYSGSSLFGQMQGVYQSVWSEFNVYGQKQYL